MSEVMVEVSLLEHMSKEKRGLEIPWGREALMGNCGTPASLSGQETPPVLAIFCCREALVAAEGCPKGSLLSKYKELRMNNVNVNMSYLFD